MKAQDVVELRGNKRRTELVLRADVHLATKVDTRADSSVVHDGKGRVAERIRRSPARVGRCVEDCLEKPLPFFLARMFLVTKNPVQIERRYRARWKNGGSPIEGRRRQMLLYLSFFITSPKLPTQTAVDITNSTQWHPVPRTLCVQSQGMSGGRTP